jgi:hypothetical protein
MSYEFIYNPDEKTYDTIMHHAVRLPGTQDTVLEPMAQKAGGNIRLLEGLTVTAGELYTFPASTLHDSVPHGLTATIMRKTTVMQGEPVIAVPRGITPDNVFRRETIEVDRLWGFIEKALVRTYETLDPRNYALRLLEALV